MTETKKTASDYGYTFLEVTQIGLGWYVHRLGCADICSTRQSEVVDRIAGRDGSTVHRSKRAANATARAESARTGETILGCPQPRRRRR